MAEYAATPNEARRVEAQVGAVSVASPAPLGLGVLAFATAILGCFYTGFIIPYEGSGMRAALGAVFVIAGIVLVLAGMWDFRKNYMMTATTFTAYGGFLVLLGLIFMPNFGFLSAVGGNLSNLMGLIFLCWTIFLGVLWVGSLRANTSLIVALGLLFIAYLLLTIGALADNNTVLTMIGGWFAIATALVAWIASIASILSSATPTSAFRIPFGRRLAVVE